MASIWKSNSARVALRSITRSLAAAESATSANHLTSSIPSRLSSICHLRSCRDLISSHSLASALTSTTNHTSYRFSSVRYVHFRRRYYDHISKQYAEPPMNFGINFVPEQTVYIIERYGKYFKTLPTGVHFLIPFVDKIACVHKLWIETLKLNSQSAFTNDNIGMFVDGRIDVKIVDPKLASYGTEDNPLYAIHELAQATIRVEIRKITLDDFNKEKNDTLPKKIMESINVAAKRWGLECLGCRINDSGTRLMPQNGADDE
ncbi:putative Band 7 domain-containing protein [Medicago truncatula]|uniref:Putative Band 7 domain-containing protein n=2 Tax=Medicago truncatula TaxID=3880 RepID=G7J9M9_MEDTR|nr:SPFH domain/band 7 family protein [Medicago truncatula]RHN69755.1 putative Band 7 domain-containing protein [Medicago truncatula]